MEKTSYFIKADDKQKGHMGTPVKNILITLLIKGESYENKTKVVSTTKHAFTV